jgi:hypothetical protein
MKDKKAGRKINWKKIIIFCLGVFLLGFGVGWFWRNFKFDLKFLGRRGFGGLELRVDLPKDEGIGGYILSERKDINNDGAAEGVAIFYKLQKKEMINFYPIFFGLFEFDGARKDWKLVFEEKINEDWGKEFRAEEKRPKYRLKTADLTSDGKEEVVVIVKKEEGEELANVLVFGESDSKFRQLGSFGGLGQEAETIGKRLVIKEALGVERDFEFLDGKFVEVPVGGRETIEAGELLIGSSGGQIVAFDTKSGKEILKIKTGEIRGVDYSSLDKKLVWAQRMKGKKGFFSEIWSQDLVLGMEAKKIIGGGKEFEEGKDFYEPKISPDGKRLAFKVEGLAYTALYVSDIDGGGARKIVEQGDYGIGEYNWMNDSQKIVYFTETMLLEEPTPSNQLRTVDIDSGGQKVLTKNIYTTGGGPVEGGDGIFYSASNGKEDFGCELHFVRKDGGGEQKLTGFGEGLKVNDIVVSRGGGEVAFVVSKQRGGEGRVFVWRASGEKIREFEGGQSRFNKTGDKLAVKRRGRVYLVDLLRGGEEEVEGLSLVSIWNWE